MANDADDPVRDVVESEPGGQLVIQKGRPRLGYLTDFVRDKDVDGNYYDPDGEGGVNTNPGNHTGAASTFYYPTYAGDGQFKMYLGNNGRVTAGAPDPAVGTLSIGKFVTGEGADTTKTFQFTVQLADAAGRPLEGSFEYTPSAGTAASGTLDLDEKGSGTITLTDGQGITIQNLPKGTQWTVTETLDAGGDYTVTAYPSSSGGVTAGGNTASGTIAHHGAEDVVTFVNYYEEDNGTLVVKKEVQGKPPEGGAEYRFVATFTKPGREPYNEEFSLGNVEGEENPVWEKAFDDLPIGTTYTVTEVMDSAGDEEEQPGEEVTPEQPSLEGDDAQTGDETQTGDEAQTGDETQIGDDAQNGDEAQTSDKTQPGDNTQTGGDAQTGDESLLMVRTLSAVSIPSGSENLTSTPDTTLGNRDTPDGDTPGKDTPDNGSVPEGEQPKEGADASGSGNPNGGTPPTNSPIPANEPEPIEPAPDTPDFTPLVQTQSGTIVSEEALTLTFVNTYEDQEEESGILTITKVVDGANPDPDAEFVFHVEYPDGDSTKKEHINLKAGNTSKSIKIPAGVEYTVYEEAYGNYTPVVGKMSGVMAGGANLTLEFHNVPGEVSGEPVVYLPLPAVRKYVSGNNIPTDREFTFTLHGEKHDGGDNAYVPMPSHDENSVTAGHGESASFGYLTFHPANAGTYVYTIKETIPDEESEESALWTYDDTVYTYTVAVEYNEGTRSLTVTPTLKSENEPVEEGEMIFRNIYHDPSEEPDPGPEEPNPDPDPDPDPNPSRPGNGGNSDGNGDSPSSRPHSGTSEQTGNPADTVPGEEPLKELPDTGIHWQLPFALGFAGIALLAFSFFARRKKEEDPDES